MWLFFNISLQKVFVMPNMDDVYIPIMHSAMDPRSTSCFMKDPPVEASDQLWWVKMGHSQYYET